MRHVFILITIVILDPYCDINYHVINAYYFDVGNSYLESETTVVESEYKGSPEDLAIAQEEAYEDEADEESL